MGSSTFGDSIPFNGIHATINGINRQAFNDLKREGLRQIFMLFGVPGQAQLRTCPGISVA
ncbi:MAG: hypothetical protein BWY82_02082 [Verrucomicrobia bacterium ADurb.Bin474]|nr:MAG: hypothetical protein BWY82_02082 [Verrucomicrobia bacterium ADurb.Bin474]